MKRWHLLALVPVCAIICSAGWQRGWFSRPVAQENLVAVTLEQLPPAKSAQEYDTAITGVMTLTEDDDNKKDQVEGEVYFALEVPNCEGELVLERRGKTSTVSLKPMQKFAVNGKEFGPGAGDPTNRLRVVWSRKKTGLDAGSFLGAVKLRLFDVPPGKGTVPSKSGGN